MALVTRSALASGDTTHLIKVPQVSGDLYAGEALDAVAMCRIHSDGLVYMSNGTASDINARFTGVTPVAVPIGEPVELYRIGARFRYGTGLTPGAQYFVAATAGRLDTAATTGGLVSVAEAVTATDIQITLMRAGL